MRQEDLLPAQTLADRCWDHINRLARLERLPALAPIQVSIGVGSGQAVLLDASRAELLMMVRRHLLADAEKLAALDVRLDPRLQTAADMARAQLQATTWGLHHLPGLEDAA